jgi:hypothetical protein
MITKFEDWPETHKTKYISDFVSEYNKLNNTSFGITEKTFEDRQDYDFLLFDDQKNILKVQHTLGGMQFVKEVARPQLATDIITELKKRFTHIKGLIVNLNFRELPDSKDEKAFNDLIYWLDYLIKSKSAHPLTPTYFAYDKNDDEYIAKINRYVDEISVRPYSGDPVVFIFGAFKVEDAAMLGDDQRAEIAINNKSKYSNPEDLILIIEFNTTSVSDIYIPWIQEKYVNSKFLGIWIHDGWQDKFIKIK